MKPLWPTIAAALVWITTAATAPLAFSAQSNHDQVQGSGENNPPGSNPIAQFQINAKSGPNGENPSGHFSFKRKLDGGGTAKFMASVTCVNVQGNLASVIGLVVKNHNDTYPQDKYYLVRLKDDGKGEFTLDEIQNGPYGADPTICPTPVEPRPEAITKGNIRITDAALP